MAAPPEYDGEAAVSSDGGGTGQAAPRRRRRRRRRRSSSRRDEGSPQEQPEQQPAQKHRVLMVTDFFYPNFGGVENHVYCLAQRLIAAGHKVVVMTHAYGDCTGVRYLAGGLKVYYVPRRPIHAQATPPTLAGVFRLLRHVMLRERATLLHAHQAFSALALEALVHARTMGYPAVFTDHSLFGFADAASIATNKALKAALSDASAVICVSHTSRENTVLRACLPPGRVSVIPNAVDAREFRPPGPSSSGDEAEGSDGGDGSALAAAPALPQQQRRPRGRRRQPLGNGEEAGQGDEAEDAADDAVTVVALSRLVYRKGADLLALAIPEVCARDPAVRFVIGGDGPKRRLLADVVARCGLGARVELLGAVPHERAREVLLRGQVFVNASLTEAFCIAIVEAASAGLLVVSTAVGGVPEVLPPDVLLLAPPTAGGVAAALERAVARVRAARAAGGGAEAARAAREQHERVAAMYSWRDVADRTLRVYDAVAAAPRRAALLPRLRRALRAGPIAGPLWCCVLVLLHWWWRVLEWLQPAEGIEPAADWPAGGGDGPLLAH